jgi:glycosyltransferase involved in cell wall biosynthesis
MYEKFGISISAIDKVEVHIAGFKSSGEEANVQPGNLTFHPIFQFERLSWKRVVAPWSFLKLLLKVKPQIIIVTTFELLKVTILYKILFGGVLLYDIQENYYRNIAFNKTYPPVIRNILALYSRLIEYLSRPFINHYILAERNYEMEFSFSKGKSLIIENKHRTMKGEPEALKRTKPASGTSIKLLYSGTISEGYGIFEAINLAEKLHEINQNITLTITGYCSKIQTLDIVKNKIKDKSFITLIGGNSLVPHKLIIEAISKADFGLLSYLPNPSTENCIPTRLFEYQAHILPMIIQENQLWKEVSEPNQSAIFINYNNFDPRELYKQMIHQSFYPNGAGSENLWKGEESKLCSLIKGYLK